MGDAIVQRPVLLMVPLDHFVWTAEHPGVKLVSVVVVVALLAVGVLARAAPAEDGLAVLAHDLHAVVAVPPGALVETGRGQVQVVELALAACNLVINSKYNCY